MWLRGLLFLVLLLLTTKPEAAQLPQTILPVDLEREHFRTEWNEFADEANALMQAYERSNVWDVKRARHVEALFDHLRKEPGWKVR